MTTRRLGTSRWLLTAAIVVSIPVAFDGLGLSVALPSIGAGLSATTSELAWVMNLTLIMMAGGALAFGRLADSIGRRRVLLGGLTLARWRRSVVPCLLRSASSSASGAPRDRLFSGPDRLSVLGRGGLCRRAPLDRSVEGGLQHHCWPQSSVRR